MVIKININGQEISQEDIKKYLPLIQSYSNQVNKKIQLSNENIEMLNDFMQKVVPSILFNNSLGMSLTNNSKVNNLEDEDEDIEEDEELFEEPFPWFTLPFRKFGFHNFLSNPNIQSFKDFAKKSDICERIISQGLAKQKIEYILKNVEPKIIIPYYAKESFKRLVGWDEPTFISNTFIKRN